MIHDLKKQGFSLTAIARKVGCDRKTVRKHLERGLEGPAYGPRQSRDCLLDPYEIYLRERVLTFPDLSGARLLREIRAMGYTGGYTAVTDFLRDVRPPARSRSSAGSRRSRAGRHIRANARITPPPPPKRRGRPPKNGGANPELG